MVCCGYHRKVWFRDVQSRRTLRENTSKHQHQGYSITPAHETYRVWITDSILIGDHLPANWFAHILEHWVTNSFKTYVFRVMLLFRRWSHATGHHQWLSRDASTGKEQHLKDFLRKRLHELEAGPAGGGQCREWQEWHTDWTVDPYSAESLCRRMDWRPQIR